MKNNNGIKTFVAVGIGAALFFVLVVHLLREGGDVERVVVAQYTPFQ